MKKYYFITLISFIFLNGCANNKETNIENSATVDAIYQQAKIALEQEDYETALTHYQDIESRFPFGEYAQQALLNSAYAHYKSDDPENALAKVDRFIRVYPQHKNLDYAIYLRGLINFSKDEGIIERYIQHDETQRDPGAAEYSLQDFTQLVNRFPTSQYSEDASQRIVYLRNRLAQYEINVAHFYLRRNAYIAALNRCKYVIEHYQRTPAVPEALVLATKLYKILALDDLASDTQRVLLDNHPDYIQSNNLNITFTD
ncbi:MAG TPA: outer membrane protein assembly factor BamD [Gammaproteobacteria bacterium]|nr:outer membrane protein assembly factor BamD [Gammaproteobacteria bacterium]HAU06278.1 outer membrane protein assembly factor BamD [Gammaproteobacteria bacterium]